MVGSEMPTSAATGPQRRHGLEDLDLFAVLFDQVADVDDALVAGARALFGGWVFGVR